MSNSVTLTSVTKEPNRLGRVPFTVGLVLILIGGMAGLLVLNIKIQVDSVELRQAQATIRAQTEEIAALEAEVDRASSVTTLAQAALSLGLRPNPHGAYIDLESGDITGQPRAVRGDELPNTLPPRTAESYPIQIKFYPPPGLPDAGGQ